MKTLASERDKAEVLGRVKALRPDLARRWGRMTAHQMVCHLCDSCRMVTDRHPVDRRGNPLKGTLVKWFALYLPVRWPAGLLTTPELDQEGGGTRPAEFAADVARLEALLEGIAARRA